MNYMNIAMIKEDVQPSCAFKNRNIKITWTVQNYPKMLSKDKKKTQWIWCSTCCLLRVSLCLQEQKNAFYHLEFRSYRLKFKILKSEKKKLKGCYHCPLKNDLLSKMSKLAYLSWSLFEKLVSETINSHDIYLSVSVEVYWSYILMKNLGLVWWCLPYSTQIVLNCHLFFHEN